MAYFPQSGMFGMNPRMQQMMGNRQGMGYGPSMMGGRQGMQGMQGNPMARMGQMPPPGMNGQPGFGADPMASMPGRQGGGLGRGPQPNQTYSNGQPETGGGFNPMVGSQMQRPMPQGNAYGLQNRMSGMNKPMQVQPEMSTPDQAPQKQAPPGYYFREDGMMLQGTDPKASLSGQLMGGKGPQGYNPWTDRDQLRQGLGITDQNIQQSPGTPQGWDIMQRIYAGERQQQMNQPAQFGRYQDGTPMSDPNMNYRAQARMPFYGGGWGK